MDFALFIVMNILLFVRPAELFPEQLAAFEFYNFAIIACTLCCIPQLVERISNIPKRPISSCIWGYAFAIFMSQSIRKTDVGITAAYEFMKVALFFELMVIVLKTPARMINYLRLLVLLITFLAGLALLDFNGILDVPGITSITEKDRSSDGFEVDLDRLRGSGVFQDPNDLAMIIVFGVSIWLQLTLTSRSSIERLAWLPSLAILLYAQYLTRSRGGILALGLMLVVFAWLRFGIKKGLAVVVPLGFVLLALFAGRITNISAAMESGTGRSRVDLWSEALLMFRSSPLIGGGNGELNLAVGHVAHNSFLQSFAEEGIVGAFCFSGVFVCTFLVLLRMRDYWRFQNIKGMKNFPEFLIAATAGYCMSMMSLSRDLVFYTYIIPGLASSAELIIRPILPPRARLEWDSGLGLKILGACAAIFALAIVSVRIFL